jgi:NAD+ kinase
MNPSIRHNKPFTHIALVGRQRRDGVEKTLLELHDFLIAKGWPVVLEQETAAALSSRQMTGTPAARLNESCDLLIVVGGDGSLLHAAHIAVQQNLPVLGVNRGRLGFLTDIRPNEFAKIERILLGEYLEEKRFMLVGKIKHQDKIITQFDALNEIVLSPGKIAHMIEFMVMIDEQFVYDQKADGLIIATPTGSTAYALSGGGPILHPHLNAMVLVPMFPHTLSNRPIVLDADSCIAIKIPENSGTASFVSGDGQESIEMAVGYTLYIEKKAEKLRLIHPLDYNYFGTLRAKLGWQSKNPVC